MLCEYGCNSPANFELKNGKHCCSAHYSSCVAIREKNKAGVNKAYAEKLKGYTYNSASAWSTGKQLIPNDEIFVDFSPYSTELVKKRIIDGELLPHQCLVCGIDTWNNTPLVLDLDHINGNNRDNRLCNLRFLCPNCHSQTSTYKGRNKNTGKTVSDQELIDAISVTCSTRQALQYVGLAAKGGNYERVNRLKAGMAKLVDARDL